MSENDENIDLLSEYEYDNGDATIIIGDDEDGAPPVLIAPPERENDICCICMCIISDSDDTKTTTCNHTFHTNCIDRWYTSRNTCPQCRTEQFDINLLPDVPESQNEYLCVGRRGGCCFHSRYARTSYVFLYMLVSWVSIFFVTRHLFLSNSPLVTSTIVMSVGWIILGTINMVLAIMVRCNIQIRGCRCHIVRFDD